MGMLEDYTKAKFFGASTDNAIKYAATKAFFSSATNSEKRVQTNYTNNYYSDNKRKDFHQENSSKKISKPIETVPLEQGELEELKKSLIFDDSNLPMNFMKKEAENDFKNYIGIYRENCIVKINQTQKKYLDKYVKALLSCQTEQEMRNVRKLYITNTKLFYLTYFSNFSFFNGIYPVKIYLERIQRMKINLTN